MTGKADTPQVRVRPPLALAIAILAGLAVDWLAPLPFLPANVPNGWIGGGVILVSLALFAWAVATMIGAGTNVPTNMPTTAIVERGPYGFSRNPIYLAMCVLLFGLAVTLDTLWLLVAMAVFAVILRYAVIAHEEAYLESKFAESYRSYRSRVKRWI